MTVYRNPFHDDQKQLVTDEDLVEKANAGDRLALDQLVRRHQGWIYNLALRMMLNPDDAAELAQEALVKIVTRISQFEGKSAFRTWAWRLVVNQCLDAKRGVMEGLITDFEHYGQDLQAIPDADLVLPDALEAERAIIIKEAMHGCLLGMLLCLDRSQRMTYILGDILEAPGPIAAELMEISPASFRKNLQRARADLYQFMKGQCGLVDPDNPCRCHKKASGFMQQGWLEPKSYKFAGALLDKMNEKAARETQAFDRFVETSYAKLFQGMPFYQLSSPSPEKFEHIMTSDELSRIFDLGQ